jgi:hypothetical protein
MASSVSALSSIVANRPRHTGDQIGLWHPDDQMKMVAHQAIPMPLPSRLPTGFTQSGEKTFPVLVVLENILSAITPIHHVTHRSRILNAQFAWHGSK